jgi:hypothetical protein
MRIAVSYKSNVIVIGDYVPERPQVTKINIDQNVIARNKHVSMGHLSLRCNHWRLRSATK